MPPIAFNHHRHERSALCWLVLLALLSLLLGLLLAAPQPVESTAASTCVCLESVYPDNAVELAAGQVTVTVTSAEYLPAPNSSQLGGRFPPSSDLACYFGAAASASVTWLNDRQITCVVPSVAHGTVALTVQAGGSASCGACSVKFAFSETFPALSPAPSLVFSDAATLVTFSPSAGSVAFAVSSATLACRIGSSPGVVVPASLGTPLSVPCSSLSVFCTSSSVTCVVPRTSGSSVSVYLTNNMVQFSGAVVLQNAGASHSSLPCLPRPMEACAHHRVVCISSVSLCPCLEQHPQRCRRSRRHSAAPRTPPLSL